MNNKITKFIKDKITKRDKVLILITLVLFFASVVYFHFLPRLDITEGMIPYLNIAEFIMYMYTFTLFALLVSILTELKLTKRKKILNSIILGLLLVQVIQGMLDKLGIIGYAIFTDYWFPVSFFVLFIWSWFIIVVNSIGIIFSQFSWGNPTYTFFSISAWISLFILIKYTKGMKIIPRIIYLYFIPALIMSFGYLWHLPLH